jgi:hypothetical protein
MGGREIIYKAAASVKQIFPESIVWTYSSSGFNQIDDYSKGAKLTRIKPSGSTPSGRALAAAVSKYPDSLILHFTDGEPNVDTDTAKVLGKIDQVYPAASIVNVVYQPRSLNKAQQLCQEYYPETNTSTSLAIDNLDDFSITLRKVVETWLHKRLAV